MYARYFLWNFAGRINQQDGQQQMGGFHGYADGDWTTGIFDRFKHLPQSVLHDNTYTPLYAFPLILGLIGLIYHYRRSKKDALIIGLPLVFYRSGHCAVCKPAGYNLVNAGLLLRGLIWYAFAIWIGAGCYCSGVRIYHEEIKRPYSKPCIRWPMLVGGAFPDGETGMEIA